MRGTDRPLVGIMTWYHYHNYGTVLQATALYKLITKMGFNVRLVQYHPRNAYRDVPGVGVISFATRLYNRVVSHRNNPYTSIEREQLFEQFIADHILETDKCDTFPELAQVGDQFDAIICGSDQIWAPSCFDDNYFLPWVENNKKMIAYAPSIGLNHIEDSRIEERMGKLIKRFSHLSIRERQGANLIKEHWGLDAEVVLDPTLLVSGNEWIEYSRRPQGMSEGKYILCYFLGGFKKYKKTVRRIRQILNIDVLIIPTKTSDSKETNVVNYQVGPAEFLYLISHASYICTDSFHGIALAVNMGVPFTAMKRFSEKDPLNQNSRIYNLLDILGLEECLFDERDYAQDWTLNKGDMHTVQKTLSYERSRCVKWLYSALCKAVSEEKRFDEPLRRITSMCCGCGTCAAVCPTGAVEIIEDSDGFQSYRINSESCVGCGKCRKVCPFRTVDAPSLELMKTLYSYRTRKVETLFRSSSGGAGNDIAVYAMKTGYTVIGCVYEKDTVSAKHIRVNPYEERCLQRISGSKYIQSRSADEIFAMRDLPHDTKVCFFGTPCQVAGVDHILRLKKRRDDAILVDLICHGVPTANLLRKYISDISSFTGMSAKPEVSFRYGEHRWKDRYMYVMDGEHEHGSREVDNDFYAFFRYSLCNMRSCYDCPYRERSAADVRLGDYWGPRFAHEKDGVSMVLSVTERGEEVIGALTGYKESHDKGEYWSVQYPKNAPVPGFRDELINALSEQGTSLCVLRRVYARPFELSERRNKLFASVKRRFEGLYN